jgi:hypothetical protein
MTDEFNSGDLRSLYEELMRTRDGASHLDLATWEGLATASLSPLDRERALAHVVDCASCARLYRAVDALRSEAHAFDPGAPKPEAARRRPVVPIGRLALAAAAVAAVTLSVVLLRRDLSPGSTEPVARSATGALLLAIEPSGKLGKPPGRFRWQAVAGVETYRVLLFSADGLPVWSSGDVTATEVPWPAAIEARRGGFLWRVEGWRGGAAVTESRMTAFDIP